MRASQPERNVVPLAATAEGGVNTLYWFANDSFVTAGRPGIALPWKPTQPGCYLRWYPEYTRATLAKNRRVNIRVFTQDVSDIQARVVDKGMP